MRGTRCSRRQVSRRGACIWDSSPSSRASDFGRASSTRTSSARLSPWSARSLISATNSQARSETIFIRRNHEFQLWKALAATIGASELEVREQEWQSELLPGTE
eukprot:758616-Hanusia_phi.AAC.5